MQDAQQKYDELKNQYSVFVECIQDGRHIKPSEFKKYHATIDKEYKRIVAECEQELYKSLAPVIALAEIYTIAIKRLEIADAQLKVCIENEPPEDTFKELPALLEAVNKIALNNYRDISVKQKTERLADVGLQVLYRELRDFQDMGKLIGRTWIDTILVTNDFLLS